MKLSRAAWNEKKKEKFFFLFYKNEGWLVGGGGGLSDAGAIIGNAPSDDLWYV